MGRTACFTHNDLDGLVCALLYRLAHPDGDLFFCDYDGLPHLVRRVLPRYEAVWFCDLSVRDESLFDLLRESDAEVTWLDHHASSVPQAWMAVCRIDTSGEACAADVVAGYLADLGVELPLAHQTLLDFAHDQDLWIRRLPEAQAFNDILGTMRVQELYDLIAADPSRVYDWTPAMKEASDTTATERRASRKLAEATRCEAHLPDGTPVRAACCWGSVSEVADAIGDRDTLVVLLDLRSTAKGSLKYHFRTQSDEIRADRLAEQLGGGGHPKASGAPLEVDVLTSLSEALIARLQAVEVPS